MHRLLANIPRRQLANLGIIALLSVLTWCVTGCKKKETAAAPPPASQPEVAGQPAATPAPVRQAVTTVAQSDGTVDLPELQRSVIRWVVANRRRPNSFEDFAATAGVTIPPPPTGKKYVITHDLHVQLVNR